MPIVVPQDRPGIVGLLTAFPEATERMGGKDLGIVRLDAIRSRGLAHVITAFHDAFDLMNKLTDRLVKIGASHSPNDHPCLEGLEIIAHGNDASCDGITGDTFELDYSLYLHQVKWCDASFIYLSGCNTGNEFPPGRQTPSSLTRVDSIARRLSTVMPRPQDRNVLHCTVYGTFGFMLGSLSNADARTERTGRKDGINYPPYEDGEDKLDLECWRGYREGSPV